MTDSQLINFVDSTGYTVKEVRTLPSEVQMDVISPFCDEPLLRFSVPLEDDYSSSLSLLYDLFLDFLPD